MISLFNLIKTKQARNRGGAGKDGGEGCSPPLFFKHNVETIIFPNVCLEIFRGNVQKALFESLPPPTRNFAPPSLGKQSNNQIKEQASKQTKKELFSLICRDPLVKFRDNNLKN